MGGVSFWDGFHKAAGMSTKTKRQLLVGAVYGLVGAAAGDSVGAGLATSKNKKDLEDMLVYTNAKNNKGSVSSKKFFNEHKHLLPKNTVLLTRNDLHKMVGTSESTKEMAVYQALRGLCEGNAAAIPKSWTADHIFEPTPHLKGKNVILSADDIHPAVIAHEMGHIIDFDKNGNGLFRGTLSKEENAWANAPGNQKDYEKTKELALGTYRRQAKYRRNGMIVGGLLAGLGGAHLAGLAADDAARISAARADSARKKIVDDAFRELAKHSS
jgi:hypothetical protein